MASNSSSSTVTAQKHSTDWLSASEFHILETFCDTFFPILDPPAASSELQMAYYRRSASDIHLARLIAEQVVQENKETQADFHRLLAVLMNPVTGLLLVGKLKPFVGLSQEWREKYVLAMAHSPLGQLRQGFQTIKRLAGFLFFSVPDDQDRNPHWKVLDYELPDPTPVAEIARPIEPLTITADNTLQCDAVVIGSGAGGGVVAAELAQAGKQVIVLEKGGYYSDADFTQQEAQSTSDLYLKRGLLTTKDLGIIVLAGSVLGGGTVVNWDTSFRTPNTILEEWARSSGLSAFTDKSLQDSFAAVEQRLHINADNSAHNRQNQLLTDGAQALGYHAATLRRNVIDCEQRCGSCGFGCRYGCKQSTTKTYLQDAYEHGARIIVRCSAERILIKQQQVVGVEAMIRDPQTGQDVKVTIHAQTVIVAAGSIHSPALLLRSGLENKHIGQHLHLHPTSTIGGVYPDKVYPWKGVMQSAYSDEFGRLNGQYGYKLETAPTHPGMIALATPWHSAHDYRSRMLQASYLSTTIVLTRDKGEGSVTLDRYGEPVINYVPAVFDRRHLLHGLRQAARIHMAAGANEVISLQSKRSQLKRPQNGDISQQSWRTFDRQLERNGLGVNRIVMFSAHQMGTNRMGIDPTQSVIDGNCQVHGVQGLFVCDGSAFPAASGVNPMLSIMGLAHRASQYIKTTL
jgi:choline dehydrogenase-like flavoprotein